MIILFGSYSGTNLNPNLYCHIPRLSNSKDEAIGSYSLYNKFPTNDE